MRFTVRRLIVAAFAVCAMSVAGAAYAVPDIPICDNGPCETAPPPEYYAGGGSSSTVETQSEEVSETVAKALVAPSDVVAFTTTSESLVTTAEITASKKRCFRDAAIDTKAYWAQRGHWPFWRIVYQVVDRCAVYPSGKTPYLTWYRATSWSRVSKNGQCHADTLKPRNLRVSGGVGSSWVVVRSEQNFTCEIIDLPWLPPANVYDYKSVDGSYNAWGARKLVRSSY